VWTLAAAGLAAPHLLKLQADGSPVFGPKNGAPWPFLYLRRILCLLKQLVKQLPKLDKLRPRQTEDRIPQIGSHG
jgi:hypothetical protein